jgi:hypothetical protein
MRLLGLFLALLVLLAALLVALHPVPSASGAGGAASWSLLGRPSVSATFMDEVLAAYHSPAVGLGQALYADGVQTGIDPVYALAFFWHESSFGTQGVARFTHSLGNIRCTVGYPSCLDGFRSYPSWAAGAADWFHLIASVYVPAGRTTVPAVLRLYAPSSENDTAAYVCAVEAAVAAWRAGHVFVQGVC